MKGCLISSSSERITEAALNESSAKLIPAGSVVFVVCGMILARQVPIGIAASPCAINQDMKAIVPPEGILADYLAEMLWGANELLLGMVETAGHGTKKLETSRWSTLAIPIPDTATQHRVTNFLQAFEKKLSEVEHLQRETSEALNNFHSALLAKAFRGEL